MVGGKLVLSRVSAVVGVIAIGAAVGGRLTLEVYYDILSAIHLIQRAGERTTLSNIGHRARVPNNRLKKHLRELVTLGFVDANRAITKRGYNYCLDYKKQVEPFLLRYFPDIQELALRSEWMS